MEELWGKRQLESCLGFDPEPPTLILSLIDSIAFHSWIPPNPHSSNPPKVYSMGLVSLIPMMCVFLLSLYSHLSPITHIHSYLYVSLIYQTHFHSFTYSSLSYLCITRLILVAIVMGLAHYHTIVVTSIRHSLGMFLDSYSLT